MRMECVMAFFLVSFTLGNIALSLIPVAQNTQLSPVTRSLLR